MENKIEDKHSSLYTIHIFYIFRSIYGLTCKANPGSIRIYPIPFSTVVYLYKNILQYWLCHVVFIQIDVGR